MAINTARYQSINFDTNSGGDPFYTEEWVSSIVNGVLNWRIIPSGLGSTAGFNTAEVTPATPGVVSLGTGITALGRVRYAMSSVVLYIGGSGIMVTEHIVKVPVLSSVAQEFFLNIGWNNSAGAGEGTNAICFRYNRAVSLNWQVFSRAGAGVDAAVADTGVPVNTTDWARLRIEAGNSLGGANFFVSTYPGVENKTPVAFIPTASLPNTTTHLFAPTFSIEKTAGVTSRTLLSTRAVFGFKFNS